MEDLGTNFNEEPLTYEQFISFNERPRFRYNNFFYNLLSLPGYTGHNYERLRKVSPELADEFSSVHVKYNVWSVSETKKLMAEEEYLEGHIFPKSILIKGYQVYLLLRKFFKDDPILLSKIEEYYEGKGHRGPDDWAAFFS